MQKIPFTKMHGLGNDFVVISEDNLPKNVDIKSFVELVANRQRAIGCDQFITYKYNGNHNVKMNIYNGNGSKALACGNASRCLSRLMFDLYKLQKTSLHVESRIVRCEYFNKNKIKVDMGPVNFKKDWMPKSNELWNLAERHLIDAKEMLCVDVANPHLVIFSKLSDQDHKIIGENFQNTDLFKDGINVNFASIIDDKIYLKVWERGVGFTYACGSGAIATFAAANKLGFADGEAEIIFALGSLKMQKTDAGNINMYGPATYAFSGEFFYE